MLNRWCGPSRFVFPVVLGLLLAVCGGTTGTGTGTDGKFTGTINIASSTWTGYAVIYIANTKETWKSHGLDVKFSDVEDPNDRLIALTAGRLEGMASTVDAFARAQSNGVPAVEVFPIDASVGGDGILDIRELHVEAVALPGLLGVCDVDKGVAGPCRRRDVDRAVELSIRPCPRCAATHRDQQANEDREHETG